MTVPVAERRPPAPVLEPTRFPTQPPRPPALQMALGVQPAAQAIATPDVRLDGYPRPRAHLTEAELFAAYRSLRFAPAEEG